MSGVLLFESEHYSQGIRRKVHEIIIQLCQRPLRQPSVVDGAELIDQQVRIPFQEFLRRNSDTKRFGFLGEFGCKWNDEC